MICLVPPCDLGMFSLAPPLGPEIQPKPRNPLCPLHLGATPLFDRHHPAGSCEQCPASWLPFRGSCYFFSIPPASWVEAQRSCASAGAHLVIVNDLDEQVRSLGGPRREAEFTGGGVAWEVGGASGADSAGSASPPTQDFLSRNVRGRGYWLGLRAVRHAEKIQGYQWIDGVPLSFR